MVDESWRAVDRRDEALCVIADFQRRLPGCGDATAVDRLIGDCLERLCAIQGDAKDRAHLAKSLCQVSCALRKHHWIDQARLLLEWGLVREVRDAFIFNELACCCTQVDALGQAEQVLVTARNHDLLGPPIFTTLINAYARRGNLKRVEQIFEEACAHQLVNAYTYSAVIDAFGKAGLVDRAVALLEDARRLGLATGPSFAAVVDAYGRANRFDDAQRAFEIARRDRQLNTHAVSAMLHACGSQHDFETATRVFAEAKALRLLDGHVYTALVYVHVKSGRLIEGMDVLHSASATGYLTEYCCTALTRGYIRAGDLRRARHVHLYARDRGCDSPAQYYALAAAHERAGRSVEFFRSIRKYERRARTRPQTRPMAIAPSAQQLAAGA